MTFEDLDLWGFGPLGFGTFGVWDLWVLDFWVLGPLWDWELWVLGSLGFGTWGLGPEVWDLWGFAPLEFWG